MIFFFYSILGESWLALTSNTVVFAKLWLGLVEDSVRLATPELLCSVDQLLSDVLAAQLKHFDNALSDSQLLSKVNLLSIFHLRSFTKDRVGLGAQKVTMC